jgi:hypothetical protein
MSLKKRFFSSFGWLKRELPNTQYKKQGKKIRETVVGGKQFIKV